LAKTIVADRNAHGPFGGVDGLDRVPGIGPGLLRTIAPHLEFSGANRFSLDAKASGAGVGTPFASHHPRPVAVVPEGTGAAALNVNRATALELEGLPGIGPALARRIVADRESRGPFATVAAMDRVSGIGPALVLRLGKLVTAP
jgi:competence ComEA-like helix-hairpin-helix protein